MTPGPDAGTGAAAQGGGAARPAVASPEEDPNAVVQCSSPPCFMHELDPSYLGYLGRDEVLGLLTALLGAGCGGTPTEEAWRRAMLRRHIERIAPSPPRGRPTGGGPGEIPAAAGGSVAGTEGDRRDLLAARLREALPRLQDEALRGDLAQLLVVLERRAATGQPPFRRAAPPDPA